MSKNYSDPEVWRAFLKEHGLEDSVAPPPPPEFYNDLSEDTRVRRLISYAAARSESRILRRATSLDSYLQELDEDNDQVYPSE